MSEYAALVKNPTTGVRTVLDLSVYPPRFQKNVQIQEDACWIWVGPTSVYGYGKFHSGSRTLGAHVFSWRFAHYQEVPKGLEISHVCHNKLCVNPEHLVAESPADNKARGQSNYWSRKDVCKNGHRIILPNDLITTTRGTKECRECNRVRVRKL